MLTQQIELNAILTQVQDYCRSRIETITNLKTMMVCEDQFSAYLNHFNSLLVQSEQIKTLILKQGITNDILLAQIQLIKSFNSVNMDFNEFIRKIGTIVETDVLAENFSSMAL